MLTEYICLPFTIRIFKFWTSDTLTSFVVSRASLSSVARVEGGGHLQASDCANGSIDAPADFEGNGVASSGTAGQERIARRENHLYGFRTRLGEHHGYNIVLLFKAAFALIPPSIQGRWRTRTTRARVERSLAEPQTKGEGLRLKRRLFKAIQPSLKASFRSENTILVETSHSLPPVSATRRITNSVPNIHTRSTPTLHHVPVLLNPLPVHARPPQPQEIVPAIMPAVQNLQVSGARQCRSRGFAWLHVPSESVVSGM